MCDEETESVGRALDCLGPRQAAGPFHYLINEQAKSLLALQELQHEVGALLEFRDLVIETFPSLRTKLSAPSVPMAHGTSPARPDWVPGVRVRRKLGPKKTDAVPDSGFSTETSSKDTHSASSTAMAATSAGNADEADDELWSLLDLIHRKGTRLKEEVETLQDQLQQRHPPEEVQDAVFRSSREDLMEIRKERDLLMSRMTDMEAEIVASRIHTSRLQEDMEHLLSTKCDLEEQLKAVLEERGEVNSRIHDLHAQFVNKSAVLTLEKSETCDRKTSASKVDESSSSHTDPRTCSEGGSDVCELDRVLGIEVPKVEIIDNKKFSAILAEQNPTVLQKHLLSSTVQNEILMKQLESATRLEVDLVDKLGKVREENEELKFQLEDKSIELEGTRAQVRILEQLQKGSNHDGPDVIPSSTLNSSIPTRGEILSTSMKNMSPIPMTSQIDQGSSTESSHDQTGTNKRNNESARRKPSKIPLKSYTAPKPPGRGKSHSSARSRSGDSPSRPHSAQSARGGAKSEANSLQGLASKGGSLPKSRNGSLVTSKDSLSSKLRSSDSLSKLSSNVSGSSFGNAASGRGTTIRKSSTPNVKWTSSGKDQPTADKIKSNREKFPYPWSPSSFEDEKADDYLDSLDLNNSSSHRSTTDSSGNKFQTANTFTWNRTKEFYDSIDSNLISSLYQQNGEELAECDSLEKQILVNME
ncbi:uncharacterized protein LOC123315395 isoform X2 [Coccinella septempunctata]|uniref:uncharacterized protein LOC123315395 isoform X2 n=1 Tax=Coccinella septempunctata TaxID=41139 RepID=UPI001D06AA19|nr:uncharacterized protein LOC123315395 isoform X2 [Coccinella septempunctata]